MAFLDRQTTGLGHTQGVTGLCAGCHVDTMSGPCCVEDLKPGTAVVDGRQAAAAIAYCVLTGQSRGVLVPKGALGEGCPERDLVVGPGQHIALRHPDAMALVGHAAPWVRARDLAAEGGPARLTPVPLTFYALGLGPERTLFLANTELKPWSASPETARALHDGQRWPLLASDPPTRYMQGEYDGRPVLDQREAAWFFDGGRPTAA